MLQKLKRAYREFKAGETGRRFVDHYQRSRGPQGARGAWKTFGYVTAGLVLVICGLVLSLPPGIPGFLLWIPGLLLLASRCKGLAMLLDRLEAWGRQAWQRFAARR